MNQFDLVMQQIQLLPPKDLIRLIRVIAELLEQRWPMLETPAINSVSSCEEGKDGFDSDETSVESV